MTSSAAAAGPKTAIKPDRKAGATKSSALRDYLDGLIDNELTPHDRLPTERALAERFARCGLTLHQEKTKIVFRKDSER